GRTGLPVIGETIEFGANPKTFVLRRHERFGNIFRSHILGSPVVFMVGHEAVKFVLFEGREHFRAGEGWPKGLAQLMGGSLLMTDGDMHLRLRRALGPAFHEHALQGYLSMIESTMKEYLHFWEQRRTFDWYHELKRMTFEISSHLILGTR